MTSHPHPFKASWPDAYLAAIVLAVAPTAIGGVLLRARPSPVREAWLELVRTSLPSGCKTRRLPVNIGDDRLLGGLDLSRTLAHGTPVLERGILADIDQGLLIIPSAERLDFGRAAKIIRCLDRGFLEIERVGLSSRVSTQFGLLAIDEGIEAEETPPPALCDRLALTVCLEGLRHSDIVIPDTLPTTLKKARDLYTDVRVKENHSEILCQIAEALGIFSLRAPLQTLKVARVVAALQGELDVTDAHLETAVRLVLCPQATRIPEDAEANPAPKEPEESPCETPDTKEDTQKPPEEDVSPQSSTDIEILLAAVQAALPRGLFERGQREASQRRKTPAHGKSGGEQKSSQRGRPCGVRQGDPRQGHVLNLMETLRAAAPFQTLRRKNRRSKAPQEKKSLCLDVRSEDFRVTQFKKRKNATTIFVVDASGSSALHRLAEVKGAVELILSECYIRRDKVAVIAFRGKTAETLLPPTRSLTRAHRCIAALPGGGGTPLATALQSAKLLALSEKQKGLTPTIVVMTDGKANINKEGHAGRKAAFTEALGEGEALRTLGLKSVLIDTSPRSSLDAQHVATGMGARYIPLPHADASRVAKAVLSSRSSA